MKRIMQLTGILSVLIIISLLSACYATVDTSKVGITVGDEWTIEFKQCTHYWDCIMQEITPGDSYLITVKTAPNASGYYEATIERSNGESYDTEVNLNWFLSEVVYTDWEYWQDDGALTVLDDWYMSAGEITIDNSDPDLFKANYTMSNDNHTHVNWGDDPDVYGYLHVTLNLVYYKNSGIRDYIYYQISSSDMWWNNGTVECKTKDGNGTTELQSEEEGLPGLVISTIFLANLMMIPLIRSRRK